MHDTFNPGGLEDTPDARDFQWNGSGGLGTATAPFDWSQGFDIESFVTLPVDDQGQSTSCGGQAYSKYDAVLEYVATSTFERRSAAYIYHQTYVLAPDGSLAGSRARDNGDIVINQGVGLETLCPSYDHGNVPSDRFFVNTVISEAAKASAKLSKGKNYAYVTGMNIDDYAQAVRENHGVVLLISGENNGTWTSTFPKPPVRPSWGHFIYAGKAKMIDGKKYIGVLNSWGTSVGENGWQWLGEDYFNSGYVRSGMTILFDTIPVPPVYTFTRDLTVGKRGIDVKMLQVYLNNHGYLVATSGPGSPGQETTYFGTLTKNALVKFQHDKAISPAIGFFGPVTREYVNGHS